MAGMLARAATTTACAAYKYKQPVPPSCKVAPYSAAKLCAAFYVQTHINKTEQRAFVLPTADITPRTRVIFVCTHPLVNSRQRQLSPTIRVQVLLRLGKRGRRDSVCLHPRASGIAGALPPPLPQHRRTAVVVVTL